MFNCLLLIWIRVSFASGGRCGGRGRHCWKDEASPIEGKVVLFEGSVPNFGHDNEVTTMMDWDNEKVSFYGKKERDEKEDIFCDFVIGIDSILESCNHNGGQRKEG